MKKLLLISTVLWSCAGLYAQNVLPKIAPVSPEAANLGKYGNLPVNLASGRLNYSIPMFTIKEGDFELPIYVSYNHTGLMAEDDPGLLGLGWTLHAGGRVVRQLRGKPDEGQLGYVGGDIGKNYVVPFMSGQWEESLTETERKAKELVLFKGADEGRLDTEPDKFYMNAGQLSGQFSFNQFGEVVFYPQKNYKVSADEGLHINGFNVTDDRGIHYTFGAKEKSSSENITAQNIYSVPLEYSSSWALTKIEFPTSPNTINLSYSNGSVIHKTGYSEYKTSLIGGSGVTPGCVGQIPVVNTSSTHNTIHPKYLKDIEFSQGRIEFDVRQVPEGSESRAKDYLHAIVVKNKNNEIITTYEFKYDDLKSNFKLLTGIKKFGRNQTQTPFYTFEYSGKPPKSIDYKHQDLWGYYKSSTASSNLIDGDRQPSEEDTKLGVLTKIYYPTGGYTNLEYEQNTISKTHAKADNIVCVPVDYNAKQTLLYSHTGFNNYTDTKTLFFAEDQIIKVSLNASTFSGSVLQANASVLPDVESGLQCIDPGEICVKENACVKEVHSIIEAGTDMTGNQVKVSYFTVKANTTLTLNVSLEGKGSGLVEASVEYYDASLPIDNEQLNVNVGGLRIASVMDCSEAGDCTSKHYKYTDQEGVSYGTALYTPRYTHRKTLSGSLGAGCVVEVETAHSRIPLVSFSGASVLYKQVEVLANNTHTQGKEVYQYTTHKLPKVQYPYLNLDSKDWKKGNLLKKEVFEWKNNGFKKIAETVNIYGNHYPFSKAIKEESKENHYSASLVAGRVSFSSITWSGFGTLQPVYLKDFKYDTGINYPEFYYLKSSEEKTYDGNRSVVVKTNYTYDKTTGYLKEKVVENSLGRTVKTQYTYPVEGRLADENRIHSPIQVNQFNNNTLLSRMITSYNVFGTYYLPHTSSSSKGNTPLNEDIIYHSYDDRGNVQEISRKDGTKIFYVWGYNKTALLAKIEGYKILTTNQLTVISDVVTLSNAEYSYTSEQNLRVALTALRTGFDGTNAQLTTYTYDPLVGVTSITDTRGETLYYVYDRLNRLESVKDSNGHILKAYEYHLAKDGELSLGSTGNTINNSGTTTTVGNGN